MTIKVAAMLAAINTVAEKFPEAAVEYYNVSFTTDIGSVSLHNQTIAGPASAPSSTAEAPAETAGEAKPKKSRAKPAAATAAPATDTAKSAAEEDLFGSANEATTPAKSPTASTTTTATKSASPSEEDDLFGETAAPAAEKPKATIEQLRKALTECQTKHGHKDHALGVLKKYTRDGNPTISTLDEAKYQDVIDACAKYVPAK